VLTVKWSGKEKLLEKKVRQYYFFFSVRPNIGVAVLLSKALFKKEKTFFSHQVPQFL